MTFSPSEILPVAESTGFKADMVEKVLHLLNLLNTLNSHPFLKDKIALKGGTAINLFILGIPRLSVDIDLNYIGALAREDMLLERPKIEQAVNAVFSREGFTVKRAPAPDEHAGGKWRISYRGYSGQSGNLEVDLNFMFRLPLWEIQYADSKPLGSYQAQNIPILDVHELAAGKLAALMTRSQARDLFDCHQILRLDTLDSERLRIAFVVYCAMIRKDCRTFIAEKVDFDADELYRQLLPTLIQKQEIPSDFGTRLVNDLREAIRIVLPYSESEQEFLNRLLDNGQIASEFLTSDPLLRDRIQNQPLLEWKAMNVRKHKGLSD